MRQKRGPRSTWAKLLLFAVGIAAFYASYYLGNRYARVTPEFLNLSALEKPQPIAPLELLDQYGNLFKQERLSGHWNLVIFGYTGSDALLQEGLALITQVKNRLAIHPELQRITRAIVITVDPNVDSPERLKSFMHRFSPDFLALTGSTGQIDTIAQLLGVTMRHIPNADNTGYRIDHSSSIALIDPDVALVGLFTGIVDAASIAADITKLARDRAE
ncbi:MAG: SCO family protein [Gammaproteobacteria bacterium]|nr:SCO family protein [Gammaproteobacteria bacterium]MCP5416929.1 SCO family protein [Chromatiaceae bacterium]